MDKLHLTEWEIYELCNWDCSLYYKHKYIRDHPSLRNVRDTTGADLPTWEQVHSSFIHEQSMSFTNQESEAEDDAYTHDGDEDDEEQDEDTDKEDFEMEEEGQLQADELAIERQGTSAIITTYLAAT